LEWTHGEEFRNAELKDWHVNGRIAGQVKKAKNLTFMTVDKAGHMGAFLFLPLRLALPQGLTPSAPSSTVPMDQPEAALQIINRWLQGKEQ
jgi:cathepsin A (carboxypeptidase C)